MHGKTLLLTNPKTASKGKKGQEEQTPRRRRRRIPRPKMDVKAIGGAAAGGAGYAFAVEKVVDMLGDKVPDHVARGLVGIALGILGGKSKRKEVQAAALGAVGAAFADVVRGMQNNTTVKKTSGVSGLREEYYPEYLPEYIPEDATVEKLIEQ